jgi:hypothetical protein
MVGGILTFIPMGTEAQGPTLPPGIINYVPVTITNSQALATPAPFQQMLTVDMATYSSYAAPNLQNVEFFYSSGALIPSWLESGNSNSATDTIYWLDLTNEIQADSSVTIYMGFASIPTNLFDTQTTGEAPQLSPSYGQYDNGPVVFSFYDNFAGTTLSSKWNNEGGVTVSNGISVSTGMTPAGIMTSSTTFGVGNAIDFYGTIWQPAPGWWLVGLSTWSHNFAPGVGIIADSSEVYDEQQIVGSGGVVGSNECTSGSIATSQTNGVWTLSIDNSTTSSAQLNYGTEQSCSTYAPSYPLNLVFGTYVWEGTPPNTGALTADWIRVRAEPPNGVMPSTTVGSTTVTTSTSSSPMLSGVVYSVPITLTNNQPTPTPAPFQQMLVLNMAVYANHAAPNMQNVEFYDSSGTVIPSWLESGNSDTASNTVFWLKLQNGIPASSSVTVYMGFSSPNTNLLNVQTTGEAPQLSANYGQYDDGASVFVSYQNFNSGGVPLGWYSSGSAEGCSYVGLTGGYHVAGVNGCGVVDAGSDIPVGGSLAVDVQVSQIQTTGTDWQASFVNSISPTSYSPQGEAVTWLDNNAACNTENGGATLSLTNGPGGGVVSHAVGILPGLILTITNSGVYSNYTAVISGQSGIMADSGYLALSSYTSSSCGSYSQGSWVRTRALPPNGVMPTVSVSGVTSTQTTITSTPATTPTAPTTTTTTTLPTTTSFSSSTATSSTAPTSGSSNSELALYAGIAVAVVIVVLAIVLIMRRRGRRAPPPPSPPPTPPSVTAKQVPPPPVTTEPTPVKPTAPITPETAQRLQRLRSMLDQGLITQTEYDEQKRKLMG